MTEKQVENVIKVISQVENTYQDFLILSKKSENDAVNEFKLDIVNQIVKNAITALPDHLHPFDKVTILDPDKIPSNSDVTLVLSQYRSCLEAFRVLNVRFNPNSSKWKWIVDGKPSGIGTYPPSNFK